LNGEWEYVDVRDDPAWEPRCWKEKRPKGLKCEILNLWGTGTIGRGRNSAARPNDRNHDYAAAGRTPPKSRNRHRAAPQQAVVVSQVT